MRIVSLLPSATELLYEFGVQDSLYGVTHECRYPAEAKQKPQMIRSLVDSENLSSSEIDRVVCQLLEQQKDIFVLDEKKLRDASPNLIISQETCEVCAAHANQISQIVAALEKKPVLHLMDPHDLKGIIDSVTELGVILGMESKALEITTGLEKRIQNVKKLQKDDQSKPTVLAIEWIEPFFTAGHWIPEMIRVAGGVNLASAAGQRSRRMELDEIIESDPDIIIMMPCGFDTKRTVIEYDTVLKNNHKWNTLRAVRNDRIFAVDANSFFSKPSIRTVDGVEILAKIICPKVFEDLRVSDDSFLQICKRDQSSQQEDMIND